MKAIRLLTVSILALILFMPNLIKAQEQNSPDNETLSNALWSMSLPAPNEWSFQRVDNMDFINKFTGAPSFSLNLFMLEGIELNYPINLSYSSNGLRLDESSGWVGLGWSLSASGSVSRVMYGKPDEEFNGYIHLKKNNLIPTNLSQDKHKMYQASIGKMDFQPDYFYYNTPICQGEGFLDYKDNQFTFLHIPDSDNKVSYSQNLRHWKVVNQEGIQFIFGNESPTATNPGVEDIVMMNESQYASSWHLIKVISPNGIDTISFTYYPNEFTEIPTHRNIETRFYLTESNYFAPPPPPTHIDTIPSECEAPCDPYRYTITNSYPSYKVRKIKSIENKNTRIEFELDNEVRTDIGGTSKLLKCIKLFDKDNSQYLAAYNLNYFKNSEWVLLTELTKVSLLDSLSEIQMFDYFDKEMLPARSENSLDLWGYYNGENAVSLIPKTFYTSNLTTCGYFGNAERKPKSLFSKIGLLKKIIFPTRGYVIYEYEPNMYSYYRNKKVIEYLSEPKEVAISAFNNGTNTNLNQIDTVITITKGQIIQIIANAYIDPTIPAEKNCDNTEVLITNLETGEVMFALSASYYNNDEVNNCLAVSPGNYRIEASACSKNASAGITVKFMDYILDSNQNFIIKTEIEGPGNRVKRINFHDSNNMVLNSKEFKYKDDDNFSAGVLSFMPDFSTEDYSEQTICLSEVHPLIPPEVRTCRYLQISSGYGNSTFSFKGNTVSYKIVDEIENNSDACMGTIRTQFDISLPDNVDLGDQYPYPPVMALNYKNGLPKRISKFDCYGNLEMEEKVSYIENVKQVYKGYKFGLLYFCQPGCILEDFIFAQAEYKMTSSNYRLEKKVGKQYHQTGVLCDSVIYQYDFNKHNNPVKKTVFSADQNKTVNYYKYPTDYSGGNCAMSNSISVMKSLNQKGQIIEQSTWLHNGNDSSLVSGMISLFENDNRGFPRIKKVFAPKLYQPSGNFFFSNITNNAFTFPLNIWDYEAEVVSYNDHGKPVEVKSKTNADLVYFWDLDNGKITGICTNAKYNQVAFTSFESFNSNAFDYGSWILESGKNWITYEEGVTGNKSVGISNQIGKIQSKSIITPGDYRVSFFVKKISSSGFILNLPLGFQYETNSNISDSAWVLISGKFTHTSGNQIFIQFSNLKIDELRLHPLSASFNTCAYGIMGTVKSITDENNRITHFEYDGFQRLINRRDQDMNLIFRRKYHFGL